MKLKIWEGATLNEATDNLIGSIDSSDMETEHIVIVPDAFSLLMERKLLESADRKAMFNISVMGLSQLALNLLRDSGAADIQTTTMADALMLTATAINNVKDKFQVFKKNNINFCYEIYKVISQFKSSGVKPADLLKTRNKKYGDLGLIYEEYENLLGDKLDAGALLEKFCESVNGQFLRGKIFYFAQFDSFTHQTYEMVKTLLTNAKEVNISLAKSISPRNDYIYEKDINDKLKALASELGVNVEVVSPTTQLSPNSKTIAANLYGIGELERGNGDFLNLISAQSSQEEVDTVARLIKYKVTKGARYKDFVVACANIDGYYDHIEKAFNALDIPYFIDKSETADRTLLANFVFSVLEVFRRDFSIETLLSLASNLLLGGDESICAQIKRQNVFGKDRYKKYLSGTVLDKVILPLEKANTFAGICHSLRSILEEFDAPYQELLQSLESDMAKEYNINIQVKDIILEAFETIEKYKGEGECSKGEFLKELKLLLSFKEVSSVPTYLDAVAVGDATASYFGQVKNLLIVGGEKLPIISGDNGLLSDDDIEALSVMRKIEPSIRMINRRNRFKLFNLLCSAENITVCFLTINDEGKKVEVPAYVDSLIKIFNKNILSASSLSRLNFDSEHLADRLNFLCGSRKFALEQIAGSPYARQIASVLEKDLTGFEINKDTISQNTRVLFFPKEYTKATQLETYFNCPFKHFVAYGLRASEEEVAEFDQRDIGNICHRFAEIFAAEHKETLGSLTLDEIKNYVHSNFNKVLADLNLLAKLDNSIDRASTYAYLNKIVVLLLTRICEEQKVSQFRPQHLEKNLSGINFELANGQKVNFVGKIDRIDIAGDFFRVMDYKTGRVDPILKDLYYGDKLQLFLYENAAAKLTGKRPAGAFYFDSRWDYDDHDKEDTILKGFASNDEDAIKAFDYNIELGKSSIVNISRNAKGEFKGSIASDLASFEEYALKVSENALREIEEGFITPKPDADACNKCPYFSICMYDRDRGTRKKERITQDEILNALKEGSDE